MKPKWFSNLRSPVTSWKYPHQVLQSVKGTSASDPALHGGEHHPEICWTAAVLSLGGLRFVMAIWKGQQNPAWSLYLCRELYFVPGVSVWAMAGATGLVAMGVSLSRSGTALSCGRANLGTSFMKVVCGNGIVVTVSVAPSVFMALEILLWMERRGQETNGKCFSCPKTGYLVLSFLWKTCQGSFKGVVWWLDCPSSCLVQNRWKKIGQGKKAHLKASHIVPAKNSVLGLQPNAAHTPQALRNNDLNSLSRKPCIFRNH